MTKQYAKLTLYFGRCPKPWNFPFTAGILGELPPAFPKDKRLIEEHEEANRIAIETVEKYLQPEFCRSLHVTCGWGYLAESE
ncbi:MAG: hypothetical protein GTN38_01515 [Candidatus Aenigmarchaeota archaeon]|nr:hypothetical protein [Candidatus Aenigmarchaeota archaeon]NIQ17540.1 hypothetical protein [Candidatus Aenigmarchaeota archaeon]NIS73118.1 hypothetical protein [Candidatus Aenigmarchaeota archaeon]